MRFFNKYLFIGIGSGFVLTIGLIFFAGFLVMMSASNPEKMEAMLQPPEFLSDQRNSVYDQTDQWPLLTLENEVVEVSEFKGKVVFLNIWATWCRPCLIEMPSIQILYDNLKDEDVVFLLISDEKMDTVQKYIEKNQFSFQVLISSNDIPDVFRSPRIPTTYILDRAGVIVYKHVGSAKWDDESCQRFLRDLM